MARPALFFSHMERNRPFHEDGNKIMRRNHIVIHAQAHRMGRICPPGLAGIERPRIPLLILVPEGATPMAEAGTPMQNFNMTLLIELIIVILFADVFRIRRVRRLRNAPPAKGDSFKGGLVGTVVDYECPLFITALFLGIQIVVIHTIAF